MITALIVCAREFALSIEHVRSSNLGIFAPTKMQVEVALHIDKGRVCTSLCHRTIRGGFLGVQPGSSDLILAGRLPQRHVYLSVASAALWLYDRPVAEALLRQPLTFALACASRGFENATQPLGYGTSLEAKVSRNNLQERCSTPTL